MLLLIPVAAWLTISVGVAAAADVCKPLQCTSSSFTDIEATCGFQVECRGCPLFYHVDHPDLMCAQLQVDPDTVVLYEGTMQITKGKLQSPEMELSSSGMQISSPRMQLQSPKMQRKQTWNLESEEGVSTQQAKYPENNESEGVPPSWEQYDEGDSSSESENSSLLQYSAKASEAPAFSLDHLFAEDSDEDEGSSATAAPSSVGKGVRNLFSKARDTFHHVSKQVTQGAKHKFQDTLKKAQTFFHRHKSGPMAVESADDSEIQHGKAGKVSRISKLLQTARQAIKRKPTTNQDSENDETSDDLSSDQEHGFANESQPAAVPRKRPFRIFSKIKHMIQHRKKKGGEPGHDIHQVSHETGHDIIYQMNANRGGSKKSIFKRLLEARRARLLKKQTLQETKLRSDSMISGNPDIFDEFKMTRGEQNANPPEEEGRLYEGNYRRNKPSESKELISDGTGKEEEVTGIANGAALSWTTVPSSTSPTHSDISVCETVAADNTLWLDIMLHIQPHPTYVSSSTFRKNHIPKVQVSTFWKTTDDIGKCRETRKFVGKFAPSTILVANMRLPVKRAALGNGTKDDLKELIRQNFVGSFVCLDKTCHHMSYVSCVQVSCNRRSPPDASSQDKNASQLGSALSPHSAVRTDSVDAELEAFGENTRDGAAAFPIIPFYWGPPLLTQETNTFPTSAAVKHATQVLIFPLIVAFLAFAAGMAAHY